MISNEDILKNKPYLKVLFQNENEPITLKMVAAKNGDPVIQETETTRHLASSYNPSKEAIRMIPESANNWKGKEIVLILGGGNLQIYNNILKFLKKNQICIIIDARENLGTFLASNRVNEFIEFISRPGSHVFFGPNMLIPFFSYIDSIPAEKLTGIRTIIHAGSYNLFFDFFHNLEDRIKRTIQGRLSDLLTRFEFEKRWIINIIRNTVYFPEKKQQNSGKSSVTIQYFHNRLENIPAVLVSAGPSLKSSIPVLKKLSNKAFILACDTALKVLTGAGIPVHGVITLDAQSHSIFHFLGENLKNTILFSDIVATPPLLRYLDPRGIIFSTTAKITGSAQGNLIREATAGTEFLELITGPVGHLQSGGSVATSAYDLLRFLNASMIILVGQDLAYTGRKIHSTGTHHNERWLTTISKTRTLESINEAVISKRELRWVDGLDGKPVMTDYVLDLYRHWFEESIPESGIRTINLTAQGAMIFAAERPLNQESFVNSLPEIEGIGNLFSDSKIKSKHSHPQISQLMRNLEKTSKNENEVTDFFSAYPSLAPLTRRAAIYSYRNREKLGSKNSESSYLHRAREEIKEMHQKLIRFFPGD